MNQQLQDFARQSLKDGLAQLPEENQMFFKRMYSHKNLDAPIAQVVDSMPPEKLDWAMEQVRRTIEKRNKAALENVNGK
jgi:ATP-dependent Zn protease